MRIALAQIRPTKGDIAANIEKHKAFVQSAIEQKADLVIFPELSITSYEPFLAEDLAITLQDKRFAIFQKISNQHQISILIGAPTKNEGEKPCISLLIFQPNQPLKVYSKKYLHEDEKPFFQAGNTSAEILVQQTKVGLAICYEVFVPEHAEAACKNGAEIYLSSVAKSTNGINKAFIRMPEIAKTSNIPVLMVNCVGPTDNFIGSGQSAIWSRKGILFDKLSNQSESLLVFDTFLSTSI